LDSDLFAVKCCCYKPYLAVKLYVLNFACVVDIIVLFKCPLLSDLTC